MAERIRKSGIGIIGDIPWGTHFCQFYQTKEDLLDLLVPYFKAGLENNEFCMWITAKPLNEQEAQEALRKAVPDFDRYLKRGQIEILPHDKWYLKDGVFNSDRVLNGWVDKLNQALAKGYDSLRLTGNTFFLEKKDWQSFADYEAAVNNVIGKYRMIAICSHCLDKCGAAELIDVVINHRFSVIKREGDWKIIESSERKRTEEALRQSEEKLHVIFQTVAEGIFLTDMEGDILETNEAAAILSGYNREELIGLSGFQVLPPKDLARATEDAKRMLTEVNIGTGGHTFEYTILRKDGTEFLGEVKVSYIRDASGNPVAAICVIRDITERKRAEEALQQSEEKYRSLVNNIPDLVWTYDLKGNIIFTSPNVEAIMGYTPKEMYRQGYKGWLDRVHPDDMKRMEDALRLQVEKGKPFDVEYRFRRKDGEWIWMSTRATVTYKKDGLTYVDGVTSDITERKQAEEALRRSEEKLRATFESVAEGITVTDMAGNILETNEATLRVYGGSNKEELIGRSGFEIVSPKDLARSTEDFETILREGHIGTREYTLLRKDGTEYPGEVNVSLIWDTFGNPIGVISITRDITERKRAEERLSQSEQRYRLLADNMADAIWTIDPNMRPTYISPSITRLLGYSADEAMAKTMQEVFTTASFELAMRTFEEEMTVENMGYGARDRSRTLELELNSRDGTMIPVEVRFRFIRDADGKPIEILASARDITERKRAEEALRKSETEYRLLVENANEGIIVACEGKLRFVNPKFVEITGYSREELASRPFVDFIHPDDRDMVYERHVRRLRGERLPAIYPFRVFDKYGNTKWLEINAVLISWGDRPATLNFLNDITVRKQMEEQVKEYSEGLERMVEKRTWELKDAQEKLVRTEKLAAIGQLAGGVGHELRNPLAAIKTSAYFLKVKLGDAAEEKVRKHLDMLEKQVDACNKIITDLLDFSRPGKTNIEELDINQVVQELVKAISAPKNVEISSGLAADLPKVMADWGQLERVFSNLISNAIQAMPGGGRLSLGTSQSGGFVEVKVADTGVGIPHENLDKVFEPLFTTKAKGVGLGLAIARALVERQGGTIEVESQVGKGTTFTVRLPIVGKKVRDHE